LGLQREKWYKLRLISGEIIFAEFQPVLSQTSLLSRGGRGGDRETKERGR